jgi:diguanylate cyclase
VSVRDKSTTDQLAKAESRRLTALRDYKILDTPTESSFDDLALLASHICGTPIAMVSLVDVDRQWFKAKVGVEMESTPRSQSFCTHAIKGGDLMTVPDATQDPRFVDNPLVTGGPEIRFYAGAPLITPAGEALGTLCVMDKVPHTLRPEQEGALKALARQVVSQLELRRASTNNTALCVKAKRDADRRARQSMRDALTRLPNRACMAQLIAGSLERAQAVGASYSGSAVLVVDLDRFKHVNDALGHKIGDAVLRRVGRMLRASVRSDRRSSTTRGNDVVGRLGGDEFTILLTDLKSRSGAGTTAARVVEALTVPLTFDGHTIQLGASVGVAHIEARHADVDAVLREADAALYAAQAAGRGCYCIFDAAMHAATVREMTLERDLRDLLAEGCIGHVGGNLLLHYQPIVDVTSATCVGFEALVRWNHPDFGLIGPGEFIPIAERTGLIVPLGAWVIGEACAQLARWTETDPAFAALSMNVNVARRQLVDPDLVTQVARLLDTHAIEPSRLRLEITESSIMHDPEAASEALAKLRALGVALYMDDFGTGHSSLGCLKRFPLDGLKIDRSFITMMPQSAESDAIVRAVLELARCFKMKVTAEGVENSEQWWLLRKLGCQQAQGFYFAAPLTANQAAEHVLQGAKHQPPPAQLAA